MRANFINSIVLPCLWKKLAHVGCSPLETPLLSAINLFFLFPVRLVCVPAVAASLLSLPSVTVKAITQLPCCARSESTHSHAWSATVKLREYFLYPHTGVCMHISLPQVFGGALLELAPRLVDWMWTQEEPSLQTQGWSWSHGMLAPVWCILNYCCDDELACLSGLLYVCYKFIVCFILPFSKQHKPAYTAALGIH